jgi:phenylalanyl-tRNA synthetase alpha chain
LSELLQLSYEKLMSGAIFSLQQQGLVNFSEKELVIFQLTQEGKEYAEKGLPGRQLFNFFTNNDRKEVSLSQFQKEAEKELGMAKRLFFIGFTTMKRNKWVVASKASGEDKIFIYTENPPELPEELLLHKFVDYPEGMQLAKIPKELKGVEKKLLKRKLLQQEKKTLRTISLTPEGITITKAQISIITDQIQLISSEMIKSGEWKDNLSNLKPYEVGMAGPRLQAGKFHPITLVKNQIRDVFHSMGFTEIRGPIVETAFYNFDCLYQPQDHPAREMHDTFYLNNPKKGKLPAKKYVQAIKKTHENGGNSGSTGWGYKWSSDIAQQTLLRTHTTATTVRQLVQFAAKTKPKLPMKVFCVDRVFRNESIDRTHLAEFEQVDGIIIGEHLTLSDLIGQITEFYKRMGFDKVITRPGFFPYTEPSMEVAVYSKKLGSWLEMGGSGIFRPEVTYAWGIKYPVRVLAWGLGMERLAMVKLKREDIRDLYSSPVSWLREVSY